MYAYLNKSTRASTHCIYPIGTETVPLTRMHSSRMRTAGLLTVSQHALGRGVCIPACTRQGVYPSMHLAGVCLPKGGVCPRWRMPGGVSAGRRGVCPGVTDIPLLT